LPKHHIEADEGNARLVPNHRRGRYSLRKPQILTGQGPAKKSEPLTKGAETSSPRRFAAFRRESALNDEASPPMREDARNGEEERNRVK
jgi:hypothetical protein